MAAWSLGREGTALRCFAPEALCSLAASPDGALLAGGGPAGLLWLWHASSGRLMRSWHAHGRAACALCWSADGSWLVSGGEDTLVTVWSLAGASPAHRSLTAADAPARAALAEGWCEASPAAAPPASAWSWAAHALPVSALAAGVARGSPLVCSASLDGVAHVWTLAGGTRLRTLRFDAPLTALALDAADGALLAGGADGRLFVAPLTGTGAAHELTGHSRAVRGVAATADGRHAITASDDGTLKVWCLASRQALRTMAHARGGCAPAVALLLVPRASVTAPPEGARAAPLAQLAKYASAGWSGGGRPWEGPPVLLRASATHQPAPAAEDEGAGSAAEVQALRVQLAEATEEAARWRTLHGQLRLLVAEQQ